MTELAYFIGVVCSRQFGLLGQLLVPLGKSRGSRYPNFRSGNHTMEGGKIFERINLLTPSCPQNRTADEEKRQIGAHLISNAQALLSRKLALQCLLQRKHGSNGI